MFFFLHSQIDRQWAAWQNYQNRLSCADDYDLSEGPTYDPATSTLQYGSHLQDEIWPWDLSGGRTLTLEKVVPQRGAGNSRAPRSGISGPRPMSGLQIRT